MTEQVTEHSRELLTAQEQFWDIRGNLETAAARYGTRHPDQTDYWQRSPAGKHVAYAVNGDTHVTSVELAVYNPARGFAVMAAVRAGFIHRIGIDIIQGVSFTMHEPSETIQHHLPPVEMHVDLGNDNAFTHSLSYQDFGELCQKGGVYEQVPLPRHTRISNWVLAHTVRRPTYETWQ